MKRALSLERGWLLVLIWLLSTSIIWLLVAIAPGISGWMNSNQHLSGWAQALGGFLAIVGAWMLGRMQINVALAAERERERTTRLRHIQAAEPC